MKKNIFAMGLVLIFAACMAYMTIPQTTLTAAEARTLDKNYVAFEFSSTPQYYEDLEAALLKVTADYRASQNLSSGTVKNDVLESNAQNRAKELYDFGMSAHKKDRSGWSRIQSDSLFCECESVSFFETKGKSYSVEDWAKIILNKNLEGMHVKCSAHNVCGVAIYGDANTIYVAWEFASAKID